MYFRYEENKKWGLNKLEAEEFNQEFESHEALNDQVTQT